MSDFGVNIEVIKVTFIDDSDTTMIADFMKWAQSR